MTDKLVDIKTRQPVESSGGVSSGEQRRALIQDGKRWQMLRDGENTIYNLRR